MATEPFDLILGMPLDITNLTGMEYVPYRNGRIVLCSACNEQCHIGPEQGKILDTGAADVVCCTCLVKSQFRSGMSLPQIMQWHDEHTVQLTDKRMGE